MTAAARRAFLMVWDGMRPDLISPELTPNLWALAEGGVRFDDAHAAFPTVTRINSATLATGCLPASHGIVGNSLFSAAVDPRRPFNTGDHRALARLAELRGGRLLPRATLADRVGGSGGRTVVASTGSPGSALLCHPHIAERPGDVRLHPAAPAPADALGPVAERLGPIPGQTVPNTEQNRYVARAVREYVLPELDPRLLVFWHTDPDKTQHARGFGSPEGMASIRDADAHLGLILAALRERGLADETVVAVASDHGYVSIDPIVAPAAAFAGDAALRAAVETGRVVLAPNGGTLFAYVPDGDAGLVGAVARAFQAWEHGGPVFVADEHAERLPGAQPRSLVGLIGDLAPDVACALAWDDARNAHGRRGHAAGLDPKNLASHGGISPWEVRNTLVLAGAGVKRGLASGAPAGNVDVAPTLGHLLGLEPDPRADGRVLREALDGGPDPSALGVRREQVVAEAGGYRQGVRVSTVDGRRYLDYGWRGPDPAGW
jgi:arylsulfatase A-like enzyme